MRNYMNAPSRLNGPTTYTHFNPNKNPGYAFLSPSAKQRKVLKHYTEKVKFLNECDEGMEEFKDITLTMCSNLDGLTVDPIRLSNMKASCKQAFCNAKSNYTFCQYLTDGTDTEDSYWVNLIKFAIKVITAIVVIYILWLSLLKKSDWMTYE
jgi:hypothetical protein